MRPLTAFRYPIAIAILTMAAFAAGDTLEIKAPDSVAVGEMVVIPIEGAAPEWLHEMEVFHFPTDGAMCLKGRALDPDAPPRIIFHATKPGQYQLAVATKDADGKLVTAKVVVNVGGEPDPDPDPDPPQSPLSVKVTKWVADTVPAASRSKASDLAKVYREASTSITTGRLATIDDAVAFVLAGSREAIGKDREAWLLWAAAVKAELESLWDAGKLKEVKSHVEVFNDIAVGLEAVR